HNVPLIKTHDGVRKLSPKDCFNLQGFRIGTEYSFPHDIKSSAALYKQSGNAVSVDIIELIAKRILKAFLKVDGELVEVDKVEIEEPILTKPQLSLFEMSESNEIMKSLLEIKELLANDLYTLTSKEELENLRKKIMIKLSESL
ncbi:MAG: DNA cytosine methyltransferase, partial [Cetobacterium sp.]